jgi:CBS domain-containing protein
MICPNCGCDNLPGNEVCDNCQHDLTALDRPVGWNRVEKGLLEEHVRDLHRKIPHSEPVTVAPTTSIHDALQILLQKNIGALLVVDDNGLLKGIFSERDLLKKVAGVEDSFASLPVSQFMSDNVETVSIDDPLAFVLHKMDVGGYRHLPVVENGKPVDIVSVRDMLRYITKLCATI